MASNSNLFKWKRQPKSTVMNKTKKKDGMSKWLEKIEAASEIAAKEAFGSEIFDNSYERSMLIPDDEAIYEAQELVSGWLQEKKLSDIHHELEFQDEAWNREHKETPTVKLQDAKSYYQELLSSSNNDFNLGIEDSDEDILVSEVIAGMMNKDISKGIDLGMTPLEKQVKDPMLKMDMRHKQIKEKSKARKAKDRNLHIKQDVKKKAQERINEEESEKILRKEKEEKEIQDEMARIRIELEKEKQKNETERKRKDEIFQQAKLQMQMELRKQRESEEKRRRKKELEEQQKQFEKEERLQRQTLIKMKTNMQCLHKHFAAWYNLVLERRVGMGKARAIADWKCKLRAWNAWKAYIACVRSSDEAKAIERKMKENYRKEKMAISHFNKKLLKLCLCSWKKYARHKMEKKMLKLEHEDKAKKMALFIKNATEHLKQSKINEEEDDDTEEHRRNQKQTKSNHGNVSHTQFISTTTTKTVTRKHVSLDTMKNHKKHPKSETDYEHRKGQLYDKDSKSYSVKLGISLPGNTRKQKHKTPDMEVVETMKEVRENRNQAAIEIRDEPRKKDQLIQNVQETTQERLPVQKSDLHRSNLNIVDKNPIKPKMTPRLRSEKPGTKPIHLAMEEREQQRRERRALIEAEKRRKEEEKLKELRERQEERLRLEEEEKQERIRKKKEEKRIQAEKEKEKLEKRALHRAKLEMSQQHYQRHLLRKYGFGPLKSLVQISRLNIRRGDNHYAGILSKVVFTEWLMYTRHVVEEKNHKAEMKYKAILLRRSFNSWKKCRFHLQSLNKLAKTFSLQRMKKKSFRTWQDYVTDERIMMWAKETDAEEHDLVRMKKKYFHQWCQFIHDEKEERIREKRRGELRKKVQTWLPDFNKT